MGTRDLYHSDEEDQAKAPGRWEGYGQGEVGGAGEGKSDVGEEAGGGRQATQPDARTRRRLLPPNPDPSPSDSGNYANPSNREGTEDDDALGADDDGQVGGWGYGQFDDAEVRYIL